MFCFVLKIDHCCYLSAAEYSTIFSNIAGWLHGSTVCSRATALIFILTSEMCSTHKYTGIHFMFAPCHLHTSEGKNKFWWLQISEADQWRHSTEMYFGTWDDEKPRGCTVLADATGTEMSHAVKCFLSRNIGWITPKII